LRGLVVDEAKLYHRNPMTPYAGQTLTGRVPRTFLGGSAIDMAKPRGRFLGREPRSAGEPVP
jgi:allantoinase